MTVTTATAAWVTELQAALGAGSVLLDPDVTAAYARDQAMLELGIDGCLLTDMSVEEAEPYIGAMRENNLDTVFLAAPTSTPQRHPYAAPSLQLK